MEEEKYFYLCNGKVTDCAKTHCYLLGGDCKHTSQIEFAKNKTDKRNFYRVSDDYTHYFEQENEE